MTDALLDRCRTLLDGSGDPLISKADLRELIERASHATEQTAYNWASGEDVPIPKCGTARREITFGRALHPVDIWDV